MISSSPTISVLPQALDCWTHCERSTVDALAVSNGEGPGLADVLLAGAGDDRFVLVGLLVSAFVATSAREYISASNPTKPPPHNRMRAAKIPKTHNHVLEDFFG